MPAGEGNDLGHWESDAIVPFNSDVFERMGFDWSDFQPIKPTWYKQDAFADCLPRAVSLLEQEYAGSKLFVLKDPRICRLVPFWRKAMVVAGITAKYVLPFRNPLEVADSLVRRDALDRNYALLLWLHYALEAERYTRGQGRIFTSFDQLLAEPGALLERISDEFGIEWPRHSVQAQSELSQFLDSKARHHHASMADLAETQGIMPWVSKVAQVYVRWAVSGENAQDYPLLDEVSRSFEVAVSALGGLVHRGRQARTLLAERDNLAAGAVAMEQRMTELADELTSLRSKADTADHPSIEVGKLKLELAESDQNINNLHKRAEAADLRAAEAVQSFIDREGDLNFLRDKADRVEPLSEAIAVLEQSLAERDGELAEVRAQHEVSLQGVAALNATLAAVEEDLRAAQGRLNAEVGVSERLSETNGVLVAQVADLEAEAAALRERLGDLENHLRQRQEEVTQAWAALEASQVARDRLAQDLACASEAVAGAEAEAARLTGKLAESEAWVFRLAGERQAAAQERARAERLLIVEKRERSGSEAALRRLEAEVKRLRSHPAPAPPELVPTKDAIRREAALSEQLALPEQARNQLTEELAQMQAAQAQAAAEAAQWRERASALEAADTAHAAAAQEAEQRLAERFGEIAALTRILQLSQHETKLQNEQSEWLRAINAEVLRRPQWWGLLPKRQQRLRFYQRLSRLGLFDADVYLGLYPDVAASGMDPLRHYILHGISEERARG